MSVIYKVISVAFYPLLFGLTSFAYIDCYDLISLKVYIFSLIVGKIAPLSNVILLQKEVDWKVSSSLRFLVLTFGYPILSVLSYDVLTVLAWKVRVAHNCKFRRRDVVQYV